MDYSVDIWSKKSKKFLKKSKRLPATPNSMLVRALHHKNLLPPPGKDLKMLDVGCFDGGNMVYFAKYGYWVAGVDISQTELKLAKNNLDREGLNRYSLKILKDETLEFPNEEFDFVLCWKTIYHTGCKEKFEKLLFEMTRVLKKGKHLIVSTFENDSLSIVNSEKIEEDLYKLKRDGGMYSIFYHFEDPNRMIDLLKKNGIDNIEIGSSSGYLLHKPGAETKGLKRSFRIFSGEKKR